MIIGSAFYGRFGFARPLFTIAHSQVFVGPFARLLGRLTATFGGRRRCEEVRLGEEFHHNGLSVRCAQIGRVPRGTSHLWDRDRLSTETLALLAAHGKDIAEHIITDYTPLSEARKP